MQYWQLLILTGVVFLIVEIFTPAMFFLSLALACFVTAVVAGVIQDWNILVPVFVVMSVLLLVFLRPVLTINRKNDDDEQKTGVEGKYIGKTAKVIETISVSKGVVTIYNERWEARIESGEEIPVGSDVKILRNESLVLYVEKLG